MIELECLAVAWAIKKCHVFLARMGHFTVITDHNPLIPILNIHRLRAPTTTHEDPYHGLQVGASPPTQQVRWACRTRRRRHTQNSHVVCSDSSNFFNSGKENLHLQELRQHVQQDSWYEALKATILQGFPSTKPALPIPLRKFCSTKNHLSIDDDLITYGCHLFIPTSLRPTLLSRLHDAHQGISRSQARACLTIYWPRIDQDIEKFV